MLKRSLCQRTPQYALRRGPMLVTAAAAKGFGVSKVSTDAKVPQTCSCGSKVVYRECCEPFHAGKAAPATAELALKARFSAFNKGEVDYLVATDRRVTDSEEQKKRDISYTCNNFTYSALKVLEAEAGPSDTVQLLQFQYKAKKQPREQRSSNNKSVKRKAEEPERNLDGSIRIYTTVEKSKFEKGSDGIWVLAESEIISNV